MSQEVDSNNKWVSSGFKNKTVCGQAKTTRDEQWLLQGDKRWWTYAGTEAEWLRELWKNVELL